MQKRKITLVNNPETGKFEIREGYEVRVVLTANQFADLMMEIKEFIEARNPDRTRRMREKRERKIRRFVYWSMVKQKFFEFLAKVTGKLLGTK
jgi:hypothetical protein